jgi:hypothetical protein
MARNGRSVGVERESHEHPWHGCSPVDGSPEGAQSLSATVNLNSHHFAGVLAALRAGEFDRAACGAMILRRRDPQLADQAYRLRLDAAIPFNLVDPTDSGRNST